MTLFAFGALVAAAPTLNIAVPEPVVERGPHAIANAENNAAASIIERVL